MSAFPAAQNDQKFRSVTHSDPLFYLSYRLHVHLELVVFYNSQDDFGVDTNMTFEISIIIRIMEVVAVNQDDSLPLTRYGKCFANYSGLTVWSGGG